MKKLLILFFLACGINKLMSQTVAANIQLAEFFIDTDPGVGNGTILTTGSSINGTVNFTGNIATTGLATGFHNVGIRVKDSIGLWGLVETRGFLVTQAAVASANIVAAEFYIDTDPGVGNGTALTTGSSVNGTVNFISSIPQNLISGFHNISIRTKDANGVWSLVETRGFFVAQAAVASANIVAAEFYIDTDLGVGNGTALTTGSSVNGTVSFTSSIPQNLTSGFHNISIRTKDANGVWSLVETRVFFVAQAAVASANIIAAEFYIDADPGVGNGTTLIVNPTGASILQNFTIQTPNNLSVGNHNLTIRVKDSLGVWSIQESKIFKIFESQAVQKSGSGNALSFDGSNDQVNINNTFTQQDFTIQMWLKPASTQVQHADIIDNNHTNVQNWVCQQNDNNTNNYVFGVHRSNGGLGVNFNLTPNVWQHLTLVKSPTKIEAYINGVLIQSTAWTGTINYTSQFLTLANWFNGGRNWNGQMDEFRFWNTPLTQSQIRDRMCRKITNSDSLFDNLVAYYNFDESIADTAFDGSAVGNNGTLTNSPTKVTSGAAIGNASRHNYNGSTSAASLTHPTRGDAVTTSLTNGAADGVQVYCVTENPNTKLGIDTFAGNNSYFGVFAIGGTNASFATTYNYNGIALNGIKEKNLSLYSRVDNATTNWVSAAASIDSNANNLSRASDTSSKEFYVGKDVLPVPVSNYTVSGCNSILFNNTTFTTTTTVSNLFKDVAGEDSLIINTRIIVTPILITTITNNITACNSVVFRGTIFTSNAIIRDTTKSDQGCDSVIIINNIRPQIATNLTNNISGVHTVTFKGTVFTSDAVVKDTIKSTFGCDSIITVTTITVIKVADLIVTDIAVVQSNITPKNKINIAWIIKNIGKANSGNGWQERISIENGNGESVYLGTAYFTNTIDSGATAIRQIEFTVPEIVTLNDSALLKIVVVPNANTTEPVFLQANNTAYADDSIFVNKQLFIKPSTVVIEETDTNIYSGYLFRSGSRENAETFILKSSNTSRLQVLDTAITIGVGLSGAAFQYKAKDNTTIDADNIVALFTIANANYASSSDTLKINDNELAQLAITLSKDSTTEGDTLQLNIVRQVIDNLPLVVNLSSSNDNRVAFDKVLTIPANQTTATISIAVTQTNKPVLAEQINFTAFANRYNNAIDNVVIKQNNIPTITLEVLPASFSESAGTRAAIAKVKRLGSTNFAVTLNIADNSNGEIFYPSSSVTINKGESEAQFFIGVNDNSIVDNARTIDLTAAVFIATCGCTVSSTSNAIAAGFVSKQITILDNDGPSLNLTISETNLPEGKTNASIITVTRNTSTTVPLTINLSSTRDSQLVYNKIVAIPIGSNKVDVPVSVPSNTINEGDRIVTFTATASGFTNSSSWAIITDRTLPDATIALLPLSFDSVFAQSTITVKSVITNEGVINIPVGTRLDFYTSTNSNANATGQLLHSFNTTKLIAPRQKDTITTTVQLPNVLGQQSVFAQVNPTQALAELSYINNLSNTLPLTFLPPYKFINVATNKAVYIKNDSIIVTGKAQALTNVSVANVAVEIYVINNQFRETYSTTTDANGNFRFQLSTLQGQLGHFSVGAC